MITERQEKILNALIQEYISTAEPVGSIHLKKSVNLDVCPATIRNDLQELTETGYIAQPHISAGRVPTEKAYRFFVDKIFSAQEEIFSDFIFKEIETAKKQIEAELKLAEELTKSLTEASSILNFTYLPEKDILFEILIKLGPSRATSDKNIILISSLIRELKMF